MKIKRLVLLSLGVLGVSMPFGAYAVNPIMPMAQQEQLQQDREVQQERNLRLDTERVETVVSEPAPINVPADQNGTSFFRLYNKCWGDTTTVSLPTLFFCKKISI